MADFFQEMIGSIDSLSEEQLQELLSILNAKQSTKKLKAVSNNDYQGTIKCEYCGSIILTNDHSWVLSNLEPFRN